MARFSLFAYTACAALCFCCFSPAFAAVTVDPENTGATDVQPGDPATWTNTTQAYIGNTGSGVFHITGGSILTNQYSDIGYGVGSLGTVRVEGDGSEWNMDGLSVGWDGTGQLTIADKARVGCVWAGLGANPNSTGTISVQGTDSMLRINCNSTNDIVNFGMEGNGTLNITGGAKVYIEGRCDLGIGNYANTTGMIQVNGDGSYLRVYDMNLGGYFNGEEWNNPGTIRNGIMKITGGGGVISSNAYISRGFGSTGNVTVDGEGSTWTNQVLSIGNYGDGTLTISRGGQVVSDHACIGEYREGTGNVIVAGTNSKWFIEQELSFGRREGGCTLRITNGGFVKASDILSNSLLNSPDGDNTINMSNGGMLALRGDFGGYFDTNIDYQDIIRFWDDSISDWTYISNATYGEDYTLEYMDDGDLEGYTVLTVTAAPEPATLGLLMIGGLAMLRRKKRS